MSLNLNRRSKVMAYTAILAVFLTAGLSACQQISQRETVQKPNSVEVNTVFYESPKGAATPQGLYELTGEMTPDEVEKTLGARYSRNPKSILGRYPRIMESFIYIENGVTKYIDIWYVDEKVDFVRYGYERPKGIE